MALIQKQLIVAVEGTLDLGAYWNKILSDYLEKIVRAFAGTDSTGQKTSTSSVEFNLVAFYTHKSAWLAQRGTWTKDFDVFLQRLSALPFTGGVFNEAAIAEGLSEALLSFRQNHQDVDLQRHCILVAASNPAYRLQIQNLERSEDTEAQTESYLSDAETVAKSFPQFSVSLSVICPKQLPKLRAIYNAGKRNPQEPDAPTDTVKNPSFLVLISENFMEARAALSCPGVMSFAPCQSTLERDVGPVTSAAGPHPTSIPPVNGSLMNRLPFSVENVPTANVRVEPTTVTSMIGSPAFPHFPPVPCASQAVPSLHKSSTLTTSQEMLKPTVSGMTQPFCLVPQAQVVNSVEFDGGSGTMIPNPEMPQQVQPRLSLGVNYSSAASMPLSQQTSNSWQRYVKVWEGDLCGLRQNQHVFISRIEGYRRSSTSATLAEDWPSTMQIVCLIPEDHMNNKTHVAKASVVFRVLNQHGFLDHLHERKLCAVIQLPSQTLLLSFHERNPSHLIGVLFSRVVWKQNTDVFKPQSSSHQQHQQLQPQQRSQLQQQHQQLQWQVQKLRQQQQQQLQLIEQQLQNMQQQLW